MASKIKTRKIKPGVYEVIGTSLTIEKGDPPKWGDLQEWRVYALDADGRPWDWLFTRYSKGDCIAVLEQIANEISSERTGKVLSE